MASESPRKADLLLVLGGDWSGRRMLKAAELMKQGYAPRIIVSNGPYFYGRPESDLAADFAAARGYDRSSMICIQRLNSSTQDEAGSISPLIRSLGAHSVLIVTSPSHTARARRTFRNIAPDLEFHTVAAPDPNWCGGRWWTTRECRKTWFFEAVKTVTAPFGI